MQSHQNLGSWVRPITHYFIAYFESEELQSPKFVLQVGLILILQEYGQVQ